MDPACLALEFSACLHSVFTLIIPSNWPLDFVPLTLITAEFDLSASHSSLLWSFHGCVGSMHGTH